MLVSVCFSQRNDCLVGKCDVLILLQWDNLCGSSTLSPFCVDGKREQELCTSVWKNPISALGFRITGESGSTNCSSKYPSSLLTFDAFYEKRGSQRNGIIFIASSQYREKGVNRFTGWDDLLPVREEYLHLDLEVFSRVAWTNKDYSFSFFVLIKASSSK